MSEKLVIFACPVCQAAITRPLLALGAGLDTCQEDGKPAVPEGVFAIVEDEYSAEMRGCALVNLADLVATHHYAGPGRLNGCCGLDGLDGPNLLCQNGHEVGTEKSDCWMPRAAVLLLSVVRRETV